jgi:hypothetical protein
MGVQFHAIAVVFHLDEMNHNGAADISEPKLAGYLLGSLAIKAEDIMLAFVSVNFVITRIHIDRFQRLGFYMTISPPHGKGTERLNIWYI